MSGNSKIEGVIQKSESLLQEKQFYEFSQRMKALGNRYFSTGKFTDCFNLLAESAKKMFKYEELAEGFDLANLCIDLVSQNYKEGNLPQELKTLFLSVFHESAYCKQKLQFINRVQRQFYKNGDQEIQLQVGESLLKEQKFYAAQKYIVNLSNTKLSIDLLEAYNKNKSPVEQEYIIFRYVAMKLSNGRLEEALEISAHFSLKSPLGNCLRLILQAAKLESKKAYTTILQSYGQILSKDASFQIILKQVGIKYFGFPEEKKEGLLSMFLQ